MPYIKILAIDVSPSIRELFQVPPHWVDGQGFVQIWVNSSEFAAQDQIQGDEVYQPTYKRLRKQVSKRIRGYQITVSNTEAKLFYLIEYLAIKQQTEYPHSPIAVKDFVRPEAEDYLSALTANTEPFTVRRGLLYEVTMAGGLSGEKGDLLFVGEGSNAFSFKFMEAALR